MKGELEMADDLIDDLMIFDKSDDSHLSSAFRTEEGVCLINFAVIISAKPLEGTNGSSCSMIKKGFSASLAFRLLPRWALE